ncbi:hypothetical protein FB567DRAFT_595764 [Paraphoma chrysanthemicola]|uniref:Uncharacterized protein n=1 Tax=Paraphoma chrysanthemicola TaxID=798071 RepID=A0A8K0QZW6_9PLEO|nr:hypothetical protein FB567DRAFT_595764 [Paraphoma chrysanthemicola]
MEGLVLSCRLIKTEVYDEMKKEAEKVWVLLDSRWPFDEKFRVPFPGHFFSGKEIVIELPYLLQDEMATAGRVNAAGNTKWGALLAPHDQYLPSNRVTFVIGHIEGNPDLETVLGTFKAGSYLRSLQGLHVAGNGPDCKVWRFRSLQGKRS